MALALRSSPSHDDSSVQFVVSNTYKRVSTRSAKLDRSEKHAKVHDWTLFVDVVSGNPDLIERVVFDLGSTFKPPKFISSCPIPVKQPNGREGWRFSTRQQTYGGATATINIRGAGGSITSLSYTIQLDKSSIYHKKLALYTFTERRGAQPLRMIKMPGNQNFGIELELSSDPGVDPQDVANGMPQNAGHVYVVENYRQGREDYSGGWKIVPDSSIVCNRNMPACNKFELVSRVLQGGMGLSEVAAVVRSMETIHPKLKVNKSMGFHVHIDVEGLSFEQIKKVCQNFIKYEAVMDSFMPRSRRDGSPECDQFFKSNRRSVNPVQFEPQQCHYTLANCYDLATLADLMNGDGRYYKLNLQNLVTGRQPTIEFRQHSATLNYEKISAWVRFCAAFVTNSARLATPTPFKASRNVEFQFESLFQYVIKDRALRNYYRVRRRLVAHETEDSHCCSGCAEGGGGCSSGKTTMPEAFLNGFAGFINN
eukprot:CAMPEP_0119003338 /NCGR_PEP_ID=MMETSP1176-20130426/504_1 /TAXON_ID=265551 /ORGANISM="Synedropsis recta cf, Strain CCMP1620" /LENGTH=480 /DNA_ID=CAMNT_0006954931 /DNA_START=18 /DNA_END=1460 /DNA_ORIENTATION=+